MPASYALSQARERALHMHCICTAHTWRIHRKHVTGNLNFKSRTYFTRTCAHRGLDYAADASHPVVGRFALLSSTAQLPVVQSTVYSHRR